MEPAIGTFSAQMPTKFFQDGPYVSRQEDKTSAILSFSGFGQHSVAQKKKKKLFINLAALGLCAMWALCCASQASL